MNKKKLDYFKKLLIEQKKNLDSSLIQASESLHSGKRGDTCGEISEFPTHMADVAGDVSRRQTGLIEMGLLHERIKSIDSALVRLEAGSYGVCLDCKIPIPLERLEVKPEAEYCIVCKVKNQSNTKIK